MVRSSALGVQRAGNDSVIETTAGYVRGSRIPEGLVFRGIPYANAPIGMRRLRLPSAVAGWPAIRDCTNFGYDFPQPRFGRIGLRAAFMSACRRNEDALCMNVWTSSTTGRPKPTMVWIHGGGFVVGSGATPIYDGRSFARDGVVLVTLNYRLHALGFLYLDELFEDAESTGNLGILDQLEALRWVRDNIAAFGGNPGNVTIFGESAGALSVGALLALPAARGLFRRAILESGAAWQGLRPSRATRIASRVLELLNVQPGDWGGLARVPPRSVARAAARVSWLESERLLGDDHGERFCFQPVLDSSTSGRRAVERIAAGSAEGVDLIVGTCADEFRLFTWAVPRILRSMLPRQQIESYFKHCGLSADDVLGAYREQRTGASTQSLLAAIEGDEMFTMPAVRLAEAQTKDQKASVWMYRFTWKTPIRGGALGACHGLEIPFVFDSLDRAGGLWGSAPPADLARAMHRAWVSFATAGDPNCDELPLWPRYNLESRPVMRFGVERDVVLDPDGAIRQLWESVR